MLGHQVTWLTTTSFLNGSQRWQLGAGQAPTIIQQTGYSHGTG